MDPTCEKLGIKIDEVGPGHASLRMRIAESMLNGHGVAHGGYLFLLADAAFAYASNGYGPLAVAQGAQVMFLRPVNVDEELTAHAVERSRIGLQGIYDVTLRRGEDVVAEFRGHSRHIGGPREARGVERSGAPQARTTGGKREARGVERSGAPQARTTGGNDE